MSIMDDPDIQEAVAEAFEILEEIGPTVTRKNPGVSMLVAVELLVSIFLTNVKVVDEGKSKEDALEELEQVLDFIRSQVDYMFDKVSDAGDLAASFSEWKVKR